MDRMTSTVCIDRIKRALGKVYFKDNIKFDKVIDYIVHNFNFVETDSLGSFQTKVTEEFLADKGFQKRYLQRGQ